MLQPSQQLLLMTRGVSPKIALGDRRRQRRKGQLRASQRRLLGRHVAVPKLIGPYPIRFGPYRDHRLIAAPLLIRVVSRLFMTLNDRGVLIDGRHPLRLSRSEEHTSELQ